DFWEIRCGKQDKGERCPLKPPTQILLYFAIEFSANGPDKFKAGFGNRCYCGVIVAHFYEVGDGPTFLLLDPFPFPFLYSFFLSFSSPLSHSFFTDLVQNDLFVPFFL